MQRYMPRNDSIVAGSGSPEILRAPQAGIHDESSSISAQSSSGSHRLGPAAGFGFCCGIAIFDPARRNATVRSCPDLFPCYFGVMDYHVDWDPAKAERNLQKHGVSFEEAATVLSDPLSVTLADPDHSRDEERLLALGRSDFGRMLTVSITERGRTIRLISARQMTPRERR